MRSKDVLFCNQDVSRREPRAAASGSEEWRGAAKGVHVAAPEREEREAVKAKQE
ncbi:hypothetical protein E2C01_086129 [Portunus trituberculatus]|uniref:Uncharacterized protein n=1 Tax=Portunus trituberculatus TaxID=210409 RepID=A0A5B7J9G0_PORTR|nr:hypothetical protein [Portunus trituberculatus]